MEVVLAIDVRGTRWCLLVVWWELLCDLQKDGWLQSVLGAVRPYGIY